MLKTSYLINDQPSKKEIRLIIKSLNPIKRSPEYNVTKLKLQVFKGIIDSITCEEEIKEEDIAYLKTWIKNTPLNDKQYKQFIKKLELEDETKLNKQLQEYSKYLEDYI